jgi:hypothetical protein
MKKMKQFFKGFRTGIITFNYNISLIIESILLSLVYLLGVGLTSIFAKLVRKDFLDTNLSEDTDSYWSDLDLEKKSLDDYYRQF